MATPAVAVLLAAVLISGVAVTGVAGQLVRVFQPRQIVAVQVSPSGVPSNLRLDYGQVKWLPEAPNPQQVADPVTAHALSGLPVLMPGSLPTGVSGPVSYAVVPHATGSLTFDAARLSASAAKAGVVKKAPNKTKNTNRITAALRAKKGWRIRQVASS